MVEEPCGGHPAWMRRLVPLVAPLLASASVGACSTDGFSLDGVHPAKDCIEVTLTFDPIEVPLNDRPIVIHAADADGNLIDGVGIYLSTKEGVMPGTALLTSGFTHDGGTVTFPADLAMRVSVERKETTAVGAYHSGIRTFESGKREPSGWCEISVEQPVSRAAAGEPDAANGVSE